MRAPAWLREWREQSRTQRERERAYAADRADRVQGLRLVQGLGLSPGQILRRGDVALQRHPQPPDASQLDFRGDPVRVSVYYLEGSLHLDVPMDRLARYSTLAQLDERFRAEARRRGLHRRDGSLV